MGYDVLVPKNNEDELLDAAVAMGWKEVVLLYPNKNQKQPTTHNSQLTTRVEYLAVKQGCWARSTGDVRVLLEKVRPKVLFDIVGEDKKEHTHYRRAGLDEKCCAVAVKNNVAIGFSLESLRCEKDFALLLGRWKQNIMLCKKYKVPMIFASFASSPDSIRSPNDMQGLFELLGGKAVNL